MATGPFSITRISEETGYPFATVDRLGRVLKQHNPPMWARSVQGNGRASEHIRPAHLVNLVLGLSVSPITDAAETIMWIRALEPQTNGSSKPFLTGKTLGEALENYIDDLAEASLTGSPLPDFVSVDLLFHSPLSTKPVFVFTTAVSRSQEPSSLSCGYFPSEENRPLAHWPARAAAPETVFKIPNKLLEIIAELWADTARFAHSENKAAPEKLEI